ncbi:YcsE-related riboflavin metabolism phosphatase [Mycoplasma crocodyli]|uniref:COF family haloacid dehalogenase(HAD)-like hydrolase n=1 Tax=Mycoplasma crocodyli (strain ATCC 51981 / MP145) TaxID=512564 RepID=D5E4Z5_MYCCM|nr:HAD family hydrolase [Mycoplasma crocodyli]ADE19612.1 COF family haloacid dehalogenase(HAD)-like hydrolase [Mycoplasma crocodyli MP145]
MRNLKKRIKIAAFDIDGTILPYGNRVFSKTTRHMFKELAKNNVISVLATAREFATIGDFLEQLEGVDYFIGGNGAFIYDVKNKKYIYEVSLNKNEIQDVYYKFQNRLGGFSIVDQDKVFKDKNLSLETWFIRPNAHNYYDLDFSKIGNKHLHIACVATEESKELTKDLMNYIVSKKYDLEVNSVWSHGLFIGKTGVTKSHTLEILTKMLGMSQNNLIAFGDSSNDYEMLRDAYYGVAMEKAGWKLKSVAKDVAIDCDFDGAYHKLKELNVI